MAAWEIRSYQIAGLDSVSADRYDIAGTAEGPASNPELRTMLKTLLADRFKLRVHFETRELPAYRLITTGTGSKLTRAATDQPGSYALDGGSVVFHATSMAAFADYLSLRGSIDRAVIDGTGMDGLFDFNCGSSKPGRTCLSTN